MAWAWIEIGRINEARNKIRKKEDMRNKRLGIAPGLYSTVLYVAFRASIDPFSLSMGDFATPERGRFTMSGLRPRTP